VLRHNGRYYLYATNPDVRCWTSTDLLNWTPAGPTITDDVFPELVPFAPEVVYADGAFYMYTSPSGHGHYVLRSQEPTGPFVPVTGNVGHAIDGTVFVDDDGRRYFYWAGVEGIWGCEMPSPTQFGEPVFTGIHMNGWTEGPMVTRRDGVYQMTLTGNHYLSRGYRINAAVSTHPLHGFEAVALNPILVSADGPVTGLGHSSSVLGPDLVSTWIVYHNLNADASRDLNIDRQAGTGASLMVLGPTRSAPAPRFAEQAWSGHDVAAVAPAGPFTAELNVTATAQTQRSGIVVGDDIVLSADTARGQVTATGPAGDLLAEGSLASGFRQGALHCWLLRYDGSRLQVRLDGRQVLEIPIALTPGAALECFADDERPTIGACALTPAIDNHADLTAVKPVPGRFWVGPGASGVRVTRGDSVTHRLHPGNAGRMRAYLAGDFNPGDEFTATIGEATERVRVHRPAGQIALDFDIPHDETDFVVQGQAGDPLFTLATVRPAAQVHAAAIPEATAAGWDKATVSAEQWDDFELSARISVVVDEDHGHGDLLLRASQLALGGEDNDARLGTDFLLGYSVQLHADRIVLARHDYDTTVLSSTPATIGTSTHEITVRVVANELFVSLDGHLMLRAVDALAHPVGAVGVRSAGALLHATAIRVVPINHAEELTGEGQMQ
jgi:hypothetical protein